MAQIGIARLRCARCAPGLAGVMEQRIETLSKGYKRRVGLAQAILHDPEILILDEPTDGLDPNQKYHVRSLIEEMAAHKAIVVSTHILEEVEAVCSRAVIIDKGRIVADGTAEELQKRLPYHNAVTVDGGGRCGRCGDGCDEGGRRCARRRRSVERQWARAVQGACRLAPARSSAMSQRRCAASRSALTRSMSSGAD